MSEAPVPVVSPPEVPAPQTLVCANCAAPLGGEYCSHCGQRHEPHVHSLGHFAGEALESITHADSRLWRTLWNLLSRPGVLTREFFAGKRVGYLPPFRLYLVISLLFFVIARPDAHTKADVDFDFGDKPPAERALQLRESATQLESSMSTMSRPAKEVADRTVEKLRAAAAKEEAKANGRGTAEDAGKEGLQERNGFTEFCDAFAKPDAKANANYDRLRSVCAKTRQDHGASLVEAIVHNIPRAMFVFLPMLALFMKLLYWRPKRYYVEHLLFLVHNHCFVFLAFAISGALGHVPYVGDHIGWVEFLVWVYVVWYIFRAMRVYYGQSRALTFAKYFTIGVAYLATSITVLLLTAVYSALTL
jgi:hypothetical protein